VRLRRVRHIWYHLDEGDRDVASFFYHLGQAAPRRRRALPLFTPEHRQIVPTFAKRYFRELFSRLTIPFAIVFDSYQDADDSLLDVVLRAATSEIPPGGRLIFSSRGEPPATFARLVAHRLLHRIAWTELRFSVAEALALSRRLTPGHWSTADVRRFHAAADGWVAGLILLLDGYQNIVTTPSFSGHSTPLFDYFAQEIFAHTDRLTRDVLLQTSFLSTVTASMANELTGTSAAGDVLSTLHRTNYFTTRHQHLQSTYEYHPLFRAFLQSQARRIYSHEDLQRIRVAAAAIADRTGDVDTAVALLGSAEDWHGLSRLVTMHAPSLLAQGRTETLERWLNRVPERQFEDHPWLLFWWAMSGIWDQRQTAAQQRCERALQLFRRDGDSEGMFLAWSAIIMRSILDSQTTQLDGWMAVGAELLGEHPTFSSVDTEARVAASMLAAIAWRQMTHVDGPQWTGRALVLTRNHPDLTLRAAVVASAWVYYWCAGEMSKATQAVGPTRPLLRDHSNSTAGLLIIAQALAWHDWMLCLPSCRTVVFETVELVRSTGVRNNAYSMVLTIGILDALRNGDDRAVDLLLRERSVDQGDSAPGAMFWHKTALVQVALARHDLATALRHRDEMLNLGVHDGWPHDAATAHLVAAQIAIQNHDPDVASHHVEEALAIGRSVRSPYLQFMAWLAGAELALERRRRDDALSALRTALQIGRKAGFINTHTWQASTMARLCTLALAEDIEPQYVGRLITIGRLPAESQDVELWPWPLRIYSLGGLSLRVDGVSPPRTGSTPHKPIELLKCLIALGGRDVSMTALADALWPNTSGDTARISFDTTLHRLRQLLKAPGVLILHDGKLSLNDGMCWIDTWAFERLHRRCEELTQRQPADASALETAATRLVQLYAGPFLEGEDTTPGVQTARDRWRRRFEQCVADLGDSLEQGGRLQAAIRLGEHALEVEPAAESLYRRLMLWYERHGDPGAALDVYSRCRDTLATRCNTTPSPETERTYQIVRQRRERL
jgi:ATP/maltotriose-dependent transcriptional regulator MalT/DNA-binding SARP family transcriptional activator